MSDTQTAPSPSLSDDRVMNIPETSDMTDLSVKTLERMHKSGDGPKRLQLSARRVGYRLRDVRAWMEARVDTSWGLTMASS